jgi:hypothetical protein
LVVNNHINFNFVFLVGYMYIKSLSPVFLPSFFLIVPYFLHPLFFPFLHFFPFVFHLCGEAGVGAMGTGRMGVGARGGRRLPGESGEGESLPFEALGAIVGGSYPSC